MQTKTEVPTTALFNKAVQVIGTKGNANYFNPVGANAKALAANAHSKYIKGKLGVGKMTKKLEIQKRILKDPTKVQEEYIDLKEKAMAKALAHAEEIAELFEEIGGFGVDDALAESQDIFKVMSNKLDSILYDVYGDIEKIPINNQANVNALPAAPIDEAA